MFKFLNSKELLTKNESITIIVSKSITFWVCTFIRFADSETHIIQKHLHITIGCSLNQLYLTFTIIKASGTTQNLFRIIHKLLMSDFFSATMVGFLPKSFFLLLIHIHFVIIHVFVSSDKPERLHLRLLILQIKMIVYIERNYIYMMMSMVYINTKTIFLPLFQTPLDNRIEIHPAYPKEACLFRWCEFSCHDSFSQASEQDW